MNPQEEAGRGRWGTAAALAGAAMLFPVLGWPFLVATALSLLLLVLPPRRRATVALGLAGAALAAAGLPGAGLAGRVELAWTLAVAGAFAFVTLARPAWHFLPRALVAVASGAGLIAVWLAAAGRWRSFDGAVGKGIRDLTGEMTARLTAQAPPGSTWTVTLVEAVKNAGEAQWQVFPALAALQTLAALALAWWVFARFAPHGGRWAQLRPLGEFGFSDHLVWVALAGLLLLVLPVGAGGARAGANALVFMGGLYALRGIGVFLFATRVSPVLVAFFLGLFAFTPLALFVLVAALLVGLGDTWLDLRRRGTQVSRA